MEYNHFDEKGNARMVDVSGKDVTGRRAVAEGIIRVSRDVMEAIKGKKVKKGDVLTVAQVAGISATKKTWDLIPMCHPLMLTNAQVVFEVNEEESWIKAICTVAVDGKTGVEMEALTGVTASLLTIYDMCKAIDKRMEICDVHLVEKQGGKSGDFRY